MHHVEAVHVVARDRDLREDGKGIVLLEGALGEELKRPMKRPAPAPRTGCGVR